MIGRIVEVADDRRHVFVSRGFMVVQDTEGERKELGQVPLDDIAAVIANAHGLSYTNNLLIALAERCAPFVLCGPNHNAAGMLIPVDGNYQQAKRFDAQIAATKPTHKRLWADIVRAKLQQQGAALEADLPLGDALQVGREGVGEVVRLDDQPARLDDLALDVPQLVAVLLGGDGAAGDGPLGGGDHGRIDLPRTGGRVEIHAGH